MALEKAFSFCLVLYLDTVLVIPFARKWEEEVWVLPGKHAEPVLVSKGQFHLVPDNAYFVSQLKNCQVALEEHGTQFV